MASVNPISDRIRRVHVVKSDELDKLIRNIYRAWSYFGILNDKNPFLVILMDVYHTKYVRLFE